MCDCRETKMLELDRLSREAAVGLGRRLDIQYDPLVSDEAGCSEVGQLGFGRTCLIRQGAFSQRLGMALAGAPGPMLLNALVPKEEVPLSFREWLEIEPFAEASAPIGSGPPNRMHRFGHRIAGTGTVLAIIEIPLSIVLRSIPIEVTTRLTPNGAIRTNLHLNERGIQETPLLQLVEELLEPRALAMEEVCLSDLEALLQSLETSIQHVTAAMAAMSSAGK